MAAYARPMETPTMSAAQIKKSFGIVESRQNDVIAMETGIRNINNMLCRMTEAIGEQGDSIDRIQFNVEKSLDYTERAKNDVRRAVEYQSRARRKRIIMLLVLVFLAVLLCSTLFGAFF